MSPGSAEVVRQPVALLARSRRSLDEQLVRFPRVIALLAEVIWRLCMWLPPRSTLRQAIVRRYVQLGFAAQGRRDLEAAFATYHPDVESIFDPQFGALGFDPVYKGLDARLDAQKRWMAEWNEWQFEPKELIDLCDSRLLILGA